MTINKILFATDSKQTCRKRFKINISLFSVFCRGPTVKSSGESKTNNKKNGMAAQTQIRFIETNFNLYCGISSVQKVERQGE